MPADDTIVGIRENAASSRTHAERIEVAARHQFDADSLEAAAPDPAVRAVLEAADGGDVFEDVGVASKVARELIREEVRRSVRREARAAPRERAAEEPQLLRCANGQL